MSRKYSGWKPTSEVPFTNKGKPWTVEDISVINEMFDRGQALPALCYKVYRTPVGVLAQLRKSGRLVQDPVTYQYFVNDPNWTDCTAARADKQATKINEETIMNNANIETKVFIQGKDASGLSDNQIFQAIAKLEVEMASLEKIKNKPKKLQAVLEAMQADIEKLVEYVDAR